MTKRGENTTSKDLRKVGIALGINILWTLFALWVLFALANMAYKDMRISTKQATTYTKILMFFVAGIGIPLNLYNIYGVVKHLNVVFIFSSIVFIIFPSLLFSVLNLHLFGIVCRLW